MNSSLSNDSPEAVVQRQLDAFNRRDVEGIAATYADDAQQFEHPAKLLAQGKALLRERWTLRFQDPRLSAQLLNRMVSGRFVIDHEDVTSTAPEGGVAKVNLVATYEVVEGRIARAWFIFGARSVSQTC